MTRSRFTMERYRRELDPSWASIPKQISWCVVKILVVGSRMLMSRICRTGNICKTCCYSMLVWTNTLADMGTVGSVCVFNLWAGWKFRPVFIAYLTRLTTSDQGDHSLTTGVVSLCNFPRMWRNIWKPRFCLGPHSGCGCYCKVLRILCCWSKRSSSATHPTWVNSTAACPCQALPVPSQVEGGGRYWWSLLSHNVITLRLGLENRQRKTKGLMS